MAAQPPFFAVFRDFDANLVFLVVFLAFLYPDSFSDKEVQGTIFPPDPAVVEKKKDTYPTGGTSLLTDQARVVLDKAAEYRCISCGGVSAPRRARRNNAVVTVVRQTADDSRG